MYVTILIKTKINFMRHFLILGFLAIGLTLSAQKSIPSVSIQDLSGESVDIQQFAKNGKITVLSFWATWCIPCKKELDAIHEGYSEWQEDYDMEVVAISVDNARSLAKVKPLVDSKGWEYTVLSDANQELMQALNFKSVPQTFLLDKDGNIVYEHIGYLAGDEYVLEDEIKKLMQ